MGTRIDIQTDGTWNADKQDWLAVREGTTTCRPVTLNLALFDGTKHATKGFIPSGTALGKVTADGLYGPYASGASDGRETAEFLLFEAVEMVTGDTAKVTAAGYWQGVVVAAKLPTFDSTTDGELDANGKTDLKFIRFE
jgi:Bacteriophage lambda head decoration protein D